MNDLRKAAEMALEALEGYPLPFQAPIKEALRQALAQPEQEPVCFLRETAWSYEIAPWDDPNGIPVYTAPVDAVNISQERVDETAKREHEPVAWVIEDGEVDYYVDVVAKIKPGTPLYTAPPKPEYATEVVAVNENGIYTTKRMPIQKREWVELTDADIAQTMHGSVEGSNMLPYQFARAIEAKLKEKNCG